MCGEVDIVCVCVAYSAPTRFSMHCSFVLLQNFDRRMNSTASWPEND